MASVTGEICRWAAGSRTVTASSTALTTTIATMDG